MVHQPGPVNSWTLGRGNTSQGSMRLSKTKSVLICLVPATMTNRKSDFYQLKHILPEFKMIRRAGRRNTLSFFCKLGGRDWSVSYPSFCRWISSYFLVTSRHLHPSFPSIQSIRSIPVHHLKRMSSRERSVMVPSYSVQFFD